MEGFSFGHRLYGDELVSAKDLNRQPGRILDMALQRPVTITRNDDAFALLKREDVARLIRGNEYAAKMTQLMHAVFLAINGSELPHDHHLSWLRVFDSEELKDLFNDSVTAYENALFGKGTWDELDLVLHEWEESALAIGSEELAQAFTEDPDEVELTRPQLEEGSDDE